MVLLVASCICYLSRNIPKKFSEGRFVSIAMISNLQIFVVGLPVLLVVGSQPAISFFVRSLVIWMNDLVVVSLIFGNLIYMVSFSGEKEQVKADIRSALQEFSKHEADAMQNSWNSVLSDCSSIVSGIAIHGGGPSHKSPARPLTKPEKVDIKEVNASWQAEHSATTFTNSFSLRTDDLELSSPGILNEKSAASLPTIYGKQTQSTIDDALEKDSWAEADLEAESHCDTTAAATPWSADSSLPSNPPRPGEEHLPPVPPRPNSRALGPRRISTCSRL